MQDSDKSNKVAQDATLAQDWREQAATQQAEPKPASDPGADLEAMRKDLSACANALLGEPDPFITHDLARRVLKTWGLE